MRFEYLKRSADNLQPCTRSTVTKIQETLEKNRPIGIHMDSLMPCNRRNMEMHEAVMDVQRERRHVAHFFDQRAAVVKNQFHILKMDLDTPRGAAFRSEARFKQQQFDNTPVKTGRPPADPAQIERVVEANKARSAQLQTYWENIRSQEEAPVSQTPVVRRA